MKLTLEDGKKLVNLARQTVADYLLRGSLPSIPETISSKFMKPCGVFVTLNRFSKEEKILRGCIGFIYPSVPLAQAVMEAAVSAATQDPRFPKVTIEELDHIVFEVSVLTPPERIIADKPTDFTSKIQVGSDGLMIERGYRKGLLLPQVPVDLKWNEEEFLCQCCMKAGLPMDSWLLKDTKVFKFQAIIFEEETPKGNIREKKI